MNIFVNARFLTQPVSGVQRYGIECSKQINAIYDKVVFLAPGNLINKELAKELDVRVVGKNTGHRWEQWDLPRYMAQQNKAPLLNFGNTAPLGYSNNYITLHDLAFHDHPEWNSRTFSTWYNFLVPRLIKRAKGVFTVSHTMKDAICKAYKVPEGKIAVTYNGISERMLGFERATGVEKKKLVLSVGSFNKRKNHHVLIEAFTKSKIKDTHRLVIVGDRSKVFSETGLDERQLEKSNIVVMSHLSEQGLMETYEMAEALVSLSAYEGFGVPVFEGLYFGCKVLCSNIDVYEELYTGFVDFCDPSDLGGVVHALEQCVNSPMKYDGGQVNHLLNKYNYKSSAQTIINKVLANV